MTDITKWENFEFETEHLGNMMYKRAIGEAPEMECTKACCEILKDIYKPGMKILDVGCCAGHYLRSLRERIDPDVDYTGVDPTEPYVALAQKAYGETARFEIGNIYDLQFGDGEFDIVMCSNVILNLPAPPTNAIAELMRVSKKVTLIRTLVSASIHLCQKTITLDSDNIRPRDMIDKDGNLFRYNWRNMYPVAYFEDIIDSIDPTVEFTMFRDENWGEFDNEEDLGSPDGASKTVGGFQRSEELIFDWHYGIITKR